MINRNSSSVLVRVWLLGVFQVERRNEDGTWETVDRAKWEKSYARPLFKRLLCASGRRAQRNTLIDDLWPNSTSPELVERYLNDAAYHLRKVLRSADLLKTFGNASGYQLADQSRLWVDVDACESLMREAEQIGRRSAPALRLLEQAQTYVDRGELLESEGGLWCHARRGTFERTGYLCRIWLAEAYEQQGMVGLAEMHYSRLLEDDPLDEDILCRLIACLHRQGMTQQAQRCYEEAKQCFKQDGLQLSPATDAFAQRLLNEPRQIELYLAQETFKPPSFEQNQQQMALPLLPFARQEPEVSSDTTKVVERLDAAQAMQQQDILSLVSHAITHGIEEAIQELERALLLNILGQEHASEIDILNRRDFNRKTLRAAAATFTTPDDLLNSEILDRFYRALKKPSTIDGRFLDYLETRAEHYWQDRHGAVLASSDLLSYVIEQLQRVITLLEGSLLPSVRTRLCCMTSGIAQLVGHLLFDMGEFASARNFHQVAIKAAQEGNNQALEAVAWGRMSFTWTYSGNAPEALRCIQEARLLATCSVNATVQAYLAAVEAEIQAILGNREFCLKALEAAESVEDQQYPKEGMYWLHFDRSRLAGYQGICFRRLYRPEDARTHPFLDEAQQALAEALALLDSARIQRRPTLLIDMADTYAQKADVEGACEHAIQALSITAQTKSKTVLKRLLTLRKELETWKNTQAVKNLDRQMALLIPGGIEGLHGRNLPQP